MEFFARSVDKRRYRRIKIKLDCVLYLREIETEAEILDISESGFLVQADSDLFINNLLVNNIVSFSFYDEFILGDKKTFVITGKAKTARVEKDKCQAAFEVINNLDYETYVSMKKTIKYMPMLEKRLK